MLLGGALSGLLDQGRDGLRVREAWLPGTSATVDPARSDMAFCAG
jgi:hypothetical protein